MSNNLPDIDIDFANRELALSLLEHIPASRVDDVKQDLVKHNVGVYFQDIPYDPSTGLASIPYLKAEERGYFKLDFLNLDMYKAVTSEEHLQQLIDSEPCWELLEYKEFVSQLNQIHGHFDIVSAYKPTSIEELAMIIALIRPGKKHLVGLPFDQIKDEIWVKTDNYEFKRAHAIAYAQAIVVQLNLICEQYPEDCNDLSVSVAV